MQPRLEEVDECYRVTLKQGDAEPSVFHFAIKRHDPRTILTWHTAGPDWAFWNIERRHWFDGSLSAYASQFGEPFLALNAYGHRNQVTTERIKG